MAHATCEKCGETVYWSYGTAPIRQPGRHNEENWYSKCDGQLKLATEGEVRDYLARQDEEAGDVC